MRDCIGGIISGYMDIYVLMDIGMGGDEASRFISIHVGENNV